MPTFIKTGFWEKRTKGFKDWLNLDELIKSIIPSSSLTNNEVDAIQNSNSPSAINPVATIADLPANELTNNELQAIQDSNSPSSTNVFVTIADLQPFVYTVFISQTSTNAPTVSVLKNTLDTITYSRTGAGVFNVISAGSKFTINKTTPGTTIQVGYDSIGNKFTAQWISASIIEIKTYAEADLNTPVDNILNNTPLYIEVYI